MVTVCVFSDLFPRANLYSNLLYKMHVIRCWGTDHYRRNLLKTSTKSLQGKTGTDVWWDDWLLFLRWLKTGWHDCFFLSDISDPVPQISKPSTTTLEADQSIDEILGLEVLYLLFFVVAHFPRAVMDVILYREKSIWVMTQSMTFWNKRSLTQLFRPSMNSLIPVTIATLSSCVWSAVELFCNRLSNNVWFQIKLNLQMQNQVMELVIAL